MSELPGADVHPGDHSVLVWPWGTSMEDNHIKILQHFMCHGSDFYSAILISRDPKNESPTPGLTL